MQVVTTHKNTDFDGLASVVAATILYPGAVPVLPKSINPNVKVFLSIHKDIFEIYAFDDIDVEKEYRDEWDCFSMWNLKMKNSEETYRAYSMANHPGEGNIIMLNIRIATPPWDMKRNTFQKVNPGICSSYIFSRN